MTHQHRTWLNAAARPHTMDLAPVEPSHIHILRPSRTRLQVEDATVVRLFEVAKPDAERRPETNCS